MKRTAIQIYQDILKYCNDAEDATGKEPTFIYLDETDYETLILSDNVFLSYNEDYQIWYIHDIPILIEEN